MNAENRIDQQLAFLTEADKLKSTLRATQLCDGSRRENSGEHSWHIALYAMTLAEHSNRDIDINRVIKMLLIHDLVEIDAGDVPIHASYDETKQHAIESAAANRIFGLLPADQRDAFLALWHEFEAADTDDAVFAKSLDRFQPPVLNLHAEGGSWPEYDVSEDQIRTRVGHKVARGAPGLWDWLSPRLTEWFLSR